MTELAYPSGLRPRASGIRLKDLREVLGPDAVYRFKDEAVESLAFDSRDVTPGTVFFAIPGNLDDGVRFVDDALARGAVAVVSERAMSIKVPVFVVSDARLALARAANAFFEDPSLGIDVLGITGTNGKTTVAHMLRHVLETDGRRAGLLGTIAYEFGGRCVPARTTTPDPITLQGYLRDMIERGGDACVMEVSSHALVQERVAGTRFRAGVFLNLTQDHLDYHGSMDRYAQAKSRLFAMLQPGAVAVLNADSPASERMFEAVKPGVHVVTFARNREASFRATGIRTSLDGSRFTLSMPRGTVDVQLPLPGPHNVDNALAAAATAHALGISELTIAHALETMPPVRGRMELVARREDGARIFVDYAHTPDALDKSCAALRQLTDGRLTVVFGCGGDRDRRKRPLMARAAARHADKVVLTSDNPRSEDPEAILDEVEVGLRDLPEGVRMVEAWRDVDRAAAIERAVQEARPGEVVLVAGKGHETYQVLGDSVIPFDDRDWIRSALRIRRRRPEDVELPRPSRRSEAGRAEARRANPARTQGTAETELVR